MLAVVIAAENKIKTAAFGCINSRIAAKIIFDIYTISNSKILNQLKY